MLLLLALIAHRTGLRYPMQKGKALVNEATSIVGRTLELAIERLCVKEPYLYAAMEPFIDAHVSLPFCACYLLLV